MLIKSVHNIAPKWGENCYIAPNATLIGNVTMGDGCSVWFNAVLRGDVNSIIIGNETNIQDGAVIHGTYQKTATTIGNQVSIGHNAIVHGCTIHNNVLIGMGAIVMDGAIITDNCIIAAGAIILQNTHCQTGWIYAGNPAKPIKPLSPEQIQQLQTTAKNYIMYAEWLK